MEDTTTQRTTRSIDVTGLPDEAVRAVESVVSLLRGRLAPQPGLAPFPSPEQWIRAIRQWAQSHQPQGTSADWGREGIYAGRGE
jgi:hypothetical protein